jgi:hypothetical protein
LIYKAARIVHGGPVIGGNIKIYWMELPHLLIRLCQNSYWISDQPSHPLSIPTSDRCRETRISLFELLTGIMIHQLLPRFFYGIKILPGGAPSACRNCNCQKQAVPWNRARMRVSHKRLPIPCYSLLEINGGRIEAGYLSSLMPRQSHGRRVWLLLSYALTSTVIY